MASKTTYLRLAHKALIRTFLLAEAILKDQAREVWLMRKVEKGVKPPMNTSIDYSDAKNKRSLV